MKILQISFCLLSLLELLVCVLACFSCVNFPLCNFIEAVNSGMEGQVFPKAS